jgi:O-antigen/teichoic acid export membrane protein
MYNKLKETFRNTKKHLISPLYVNSFFIMLTLATSSVIGFIFWIIAAKTYNPSSVGISTALISSLTLISMISMLGFDQSIIRFFPERDKSKIFSTAAIITIVATTIFGLIFILGIDLWAPSLSLVKNNALMFYVFLMTNVLTVLAGNAFLALRKAKYYFLQNMITGSRLILLFPFVIFGSLGVFNSYGASFVIALIFSILLLFKFGIHPKKLDKSFLKDSFHFSMGNYTFGILTAVPSQILAIIILNVLGAEQTAYYYIAFTIASILFIIPFAFSTSLFVEGSHGEPLKKNILRSIRSIFSLLIPLAIILYFLGGYILNLIGSNYINALGIFNLMIVSSIFMVPYHIFISIKKVQKDMKSLIFIGVLLTTLAIGLSYVLMIKYGLLGVGYGWIITYVAISIIVVIIALKEKWIAK